MWLMTGGFDTFNYRENAIRRAGGPENEAAVVAVAEHLHLNESTHPNGLVATPCSCCWIRSGNAIRALHEAGFELVAQVGGAQ
jgi:hypothetical protein